MGTIDVLVLMVVMAIVPALSAQQPIEPQPMRFDFTAFLGYRTGMSFPVEPHFTGTNSRVVVDASPSYGIYPTPKNGPTRTDSCSLLQKAADSFWQTLHRIARLRSKEQGALSQRSVVAFREPQS
jgi:hypothetical protein